MTTTGEIPQAVNDIVTANIEKKNVIATANTVALPGALSDVFSPVQDITAASRKVRQFYDADWEVLEAIQHPIRNMKDGNAEGYTPSGPQARILCFIFTRDVDEVDEILKLGISALQSAADKEFRKAHVMDLIAISKAIYQQLALYWEPVIRYAAESSDDGEKKT